MNRTSAALYLSCATGASVLRVWGAALNAARLVAVVLRNAFKFIMGLYTRIEASPALLCIIDDGACWNNNFPSTGIG
jgi:hypothetical protein